MDNKYQNNNCDETNKLYNGMPDQVKKDIERLTLRVSKFDNLIKVCVFLNLFTISINSYPLLKKLQETLMNKDFTILSLMILSIFSIISLLIPVIEEFEYRKLVKDFKLDDESEEYQKEFENKIEKFYNKYEPWYKMQKITSHIIKGLAIGFLIYFCVTLGPKFNI